MFVLSFYIFSSFLSYSDCKKFVVPNITLIAMSIFLVIFGTIESKITLPSIILTLLVLMFFVIILILMPKMILGGGDIKYMIIIAFYLGLKPFALFLIISGLLQTILLLYKQKLKKRRIAPMVPVMFISVIIVDFLIHKGYYPFTY